MVKKAEPKGEAKPRTKAKSKTMAKKQPAKVVARVPAEFVFWCHDGSVFADLRELAEGLVAMSDDTFAYHSNQYKQDFANWVRDIIKNKKLAGELQRSTSKAEAAKLVGNRDITLNRT